MWRWPSSGSTWVPLWERPGGSCQVKWANGTSVPLDGLGPSVSGRFTCFSPLTGRPRAHRARSREDTHRTLSQGFGVTRQEMTLSMEQGGDLKPVLRAQHVVGPCVCKKVPRLTLKWDLAQSGGGKERCGPQCEDHMQRGWAGLSRPRASFPSLPSGKKLGGHTETPPRTSRVALSLVPGAGQLGCRQQVAVAVVPPRSGPRAKAACLRLGLQGVPGPRQSPCGLVLWALREKMPHREDRQRCGVVGVVTSTHFSTHLDSMV